VKEGHRNLVNRWHALNACPAARIPGPKNTNIENRRPCRDGTEVRDVLMRGVRHKWPTADPFDLTQMSWDSFRRFSLLEEFAAAASRRASALRRAVAAQKPGRASQFSHLAAGNRRNGHGVASFGGETVCAT
jgi:hypothetical protein